jgi:hypothetical protein
MEEKKLFIVEFGEPELNGGFWAGSYCRQSPIFVVAKDYNEAADKAMAYVEYKKTITPKPKRDVLTSDGSLNYFREETDEPIKIRGIKLASEEVIW